MVHEVARWSGDVRMHLTVKESHIRTYRKMLKEKDDVIKVREGLFQQVAAFLHAMGPDLAEKLGTGREDTTQQLTPTKQNLDRIARMRKHQEKSVTLGEGDGEKDEGKTDKDIITDILGMAVARVAGDSGPLEDKK
eukprot:GHVQ01000692.1.p1 GENE.GHVQ01000692.1~~GHVQ01000692.1.p1  ORF type:complete len:136 (+),score=26.75 GHVQ01000692.1:624-1031(+)